MKHINPVWWNWDGKSWRKVVVKIVGEAVFTSFKNARSNNIIVNWIIVKEKALNQAKSLELPDFQVSDGWLDKWKQRRNVTFKAVSRKENVTPEMTTSWSETYLLPISSKYEQKDIYNAEEFAPFYQTLPDKSLHCKRRRCSGGNRSKVRLTGLAAGNATGEKLSLFLIGKSAKHVVSMV